MTAHKAVIRRALAGDAKAFNAVSAADLQTVSMAESAPRFVLRSPAVAAVLKDYIAGRISQGEAQRWASFMRWGHLSPSHGGPIRPLDIDYDLDHEDAIVECLARLDELGDLIDGELREGEAEELLEALGV